MRIGIPRTLTYYAYYPLWDRFLKDLGCQVVVSDRTSKQVLDDGVKFAVNDACIPIKLFHGHVQNLKDKADLIFVPRMMNLTREKTVTYCPKFLGLPDMLRASMEDLPPIIDLKIDMRDRWKQRQQEFERIGIMLGARQWKVNLAFHRAMAYNKEYNKRISSTREPVNAIEILLDKAVLPKPPSNPIRLAVVGYPYLLYDDFVSAGLIDKLLKMGIETLTPEMVPERTRDKMARRLPKNLFWTFSNQVVRSAIYYLEKGNIDGIIHVTAFGCGPDSMVGKLIELEAKEKTIPFICVSLDEHTGEAGVLTRLEAFVDMLRYRRNRK
jgi:predicted nucleotide-binding protein (sugar kinase/HSP70/actin superfamily)